MPIINSLEVLQTIYVVSIDITFGHIFGIIGESCFYHSYFYIGSKKKSELSTSTFTENGGYYEKAH